MEQTIAFNDKRLTLSEAKDVISSREYQKLINLAPKYPTYTEFPMSINEWLNIGDSLQNNKVNDEPVQEIEFIQSLTEWGKEYLIDSTAPVIEQSKSFGMLLSNLKNLLESEFVNFNQFVDIWDRFVLAYGGPDFLQGRYINYSVVRGVFGELTEIEEARINVVNLFFGLKQTGILGTKISESDKLTRVLLKEMVYEINSIDVEASESVPDFQLNSKYSEQFSVFIRKLVEKGVPFSAENFEKYKDAWNFKYLSSMVARLQSGVANGDLGRTVLKNEEFAYTYSANRDGTVEKVSSEKRSITAPPTRNSRKSKIIKTTGVAGTVGTQKNREVEMDGMTKKRKNTTNASKRVSNRVRNNLFYSDNSKHD
ncbi:hypothetical protein D0504_04365 [Weissella confusa]|uniref:hypothetical protein n=1 Tax=Weissella confusa TaxID=1583 RepID=UPI0021C0F64D|nr:hypothetical protein [Weissella confusa]MCT8392971.1 hypothetical protein [Weissella confusa]